MFPVIRLNRGASPFPGYDRKVFVFPHVHPPPNSHVYDYFPIAKAIIQVPLVSQQSGEVLSIQSFPNCCDCLRYQNKLTKFRCPSCCIFLDFNSRSSKISAVSLMVVIFFLWKLRLTLKTSVSILGHKIKVST